jgi:adenine-specific DNA-methyltransferase
MPDIDKAKPDLALSPNVADERRSQLAALIPEAFSEGQLDIGALKRALGEASVIESGERYALTWAGKANAYKVLQTPSSATLRPHSASCRSTSTRHSMSSSRARTWKC